jgi:type VI secretion system protein ImpJ
MNAREIPESIEWHEGMLLTPEHFHQTTLRHEMLVAYGLACTPYLWGVRDFQWDANLLASGVVSVTALEALLPDGLVVALDEAGALRLDLKPYAEEMKQAPVPISLVVPARKPAPAQGDLERFASRPAVPEKDEDAGRNGNAIPRLHPRLGLLAGEVPPKYVGIPLLRVSYENEVFTASPDHPLLTVPLRSRIGHLCSAAAQRIREKALYLSERARNPDADPDGTLELESKRLIHSLVAALPTFEALLYTGEAHPYSLYLGLCSLAGNLAGVGISQIPPVFAPYDHTSPRTSFEEVRNYIFQVIDEGISETWSAFRLHRDGDVFRLPSKTGWADLVPWGKPVRRAPLVLALRGPSGATGKDMLDWGTSAVIGSENVVRSLVSRRILGPSRRQVEALEDLIPGKGTLLFEIAADPEFIRRDEELQIFDRRVGAVLPAEVLLFVRKQA